MSQESNISSQEKNFKVIERAKTKRKSKLLQNIEDEPIPISQKEIRRLQKKIKFSFVYERQGFEKDMVRDFRSKLAQIINRRYKDKLVKKIPDEFELELKITPKSTRGQKYLVYLTNKGELLTIDSNMKYDPKNFEWCKGIEDQEWGNIEDSF